MALPSRPWQVWVSQAASLVAVLCGQGPGGRLCIHPGAAVRWA